LPIADLQIFNQQFSINSSFAAATAISPRRKIGTIVKVFYTPDWLSDE
jgi:hypothetical protein